MIKVVYKYNLSLGYTALNLPKGYKILKVDNQREILCLWALVPLSETLVEKVEFFVFGTGHSIERESLDYIETVFMDNGDLVWHVFKVN